MPNNRNHLLKFAEFRIDPLQRLLFSGDRVIPIAPKVFDTLMAFLESNGRVLEKDELLKTIWPDTFVEEGSLTSNVSILRRALGEGPDDQKFIQTIPKRGYRFIAPVEMLLDDAPSSRDETYQPPKPRAVIEPDPRRFGIRWAMRIAGVVAILVSGWQIAEWIHRASGGSGDQACIRSIAVLPFENLSRDPSEDYFSDGITDAIISSIAQIRSLRVISRRSAMRYKKTGKSLRDIAAELGVDAILEGSVQREENKVKISTELIQASTDAHVWAKTYEFDLSNLLQLENDLAHAIAKEIQMQAALQSHEHSAAVRRINPDAEDLYLLGRHHAERRVEADLRQAIEEYQEAVRLQPDFAAAYAGLARAWVERGIWGGAEFRDAERPARSAAEKAIALDSELGDAHAVMGQVMTFYDSAWDKAGREFRRALELDPSSVYAHQAYGILLEALGRFKEALAEEQRAVLLDPMSSLIESEIARVLFRARQWDDSARHYQRAIELDPKDFGAYTRLADVYEQTGRYNNAVDLLENAIRLRGVSPAKQYPALGRAYALAGRRDDARDVLANILVAPKPGWTVEISLIYFALKDRERGFEWLRRGFEQGQPVLFLMFDPRFDEVRGDPRFQQLIRRLQIPENHSEIMR